MGRMLSVAAVLASLVVSAAPVQGQQTGTLAADILADWEEQQQLIMGIADAMPADRFDFKTTPEQRTYAEQILHIVEVNSMLFESLRAKTPPPAINMNVTSKADVLRALKQSYDHGAAVFREFDDADMAEGIDGPSFLGRSTRARVAYFAISHAMDNYGQMAVYLRVNDIVPPASRPRP